MVALRFRCCFFSLAACLICAAAVGQDEIGRKSIDEAFRTGLTSLADKADELGLKDEATVTRDWFIERDPKRQYLFLVEPPSVADADPTTLRGKWFAKFQQLRTEQADQLLELARERLLAGQATTAYQLLHEALHEDPAHQRATQILGHRPLTDRSFRRIVGRSAHPQFGWQRRTYWQIESPHFLVTTDTSPDTGVEVARLLEDLHSIWRQVFFDHWSSPRALNARFEGRSISLGRQPKHKVVVFRDREEYVEKLAPVERNIAITDGYYMKDRRTAYLYHGETSLRKIWIHEVVHQLFQETGRAEADVGDRWNFWVVEAVALYFESLVKHDRFYTLGGFDADRLQLARLRRFTGQFYMPTAELVTMGREALQNRNEIRQIYTQAAGLAHFLMDADGGRYRPKFIQLIEAVYQSRDSTDALSVLLGESFETIDEQYAEFLQVEDQDLPFRNPPAAIQRLYLGRTKLTDRELAQLAHLDQLEWLDLSQTRVGDAGVERLGQLPKLRRLDLANTLVTDASLEAIAALPQLEELNLSGNAVGDDGVAQLASAKKLKVLLLGGTRVTDRSLHVLRELDALRQVDIRGTRVSDAAWEAFREKLPLPELPR